MNKKLKGLLIILLLLITISCYQEKKKIIIVSEVKHRDGYYQENYETVYIRGIPKEVDHGYAVSGRWYFDVRDINDTACLNIHSVHADDSFLGNDDYDKGDTLEISLEEYQDIFNSPKQDENQTEAGRTIIIINNVVVVDTIINP